MSFCFSMKRLQKQSLALILFLLLFISHGGFEQVRDFFLLKGRFLRILMIKKGGVPEKNAAW